MKTKVYTERSQSANFFEFTSYKFEPDKKRIFFNYKTELKDRPPLFFKETIILPRIPDLKKIPKELTDKLLQSLHIILGISYYKLYCPPAVAFAKAGATLSRKEADFWNTVYKKGLGEFFYINKLDPKISPKFPYSKTWTDKQKNYKPKSISYILNSKSLVAIGGGKDSVVALELLKNKFDITAFFVQTSKGSELVNKIINISGAKHLKIKRYLDNQVFQEHQYQGHIPISAVYAFLGLLSAVLYKYSYIIVGNEYSSNFGNLKYKGIEINHQWSKSFEFEKLFQNYVKNFITPDITYFSLLRPFYEIRVVKMFAKIKKYFPYFSSCNSNFKINSKSNSLWCCQCPKCVFVFTLLSAYLGKQELVKIFGKNLYQEKNLLPTFKDILGFGKIHPHTNLKNSFGITIKKSEAALPVINNNPNIIGKIGVGVKPFDCVGTFEEAQSALFLAKNRFKKDFIIQQLGRRVKYYQEAFKTQKESAVPEQFKFLGMENALILRYGMEGRVVKRYFKKYHPELKVGIADDKDYLKDQPKFDIVVKTPGINKKVVKIPYTTPTNIFFSKIKGANIIIGVTGSKGKSTTASLIYEIIKASGKKVELLGNIGKPMLERLLKPVSRKTIFVLELSSFQLDDIKFSPDIAVVTNLFEEHMDFHGGEEEYYQAKKNIINHQKSNEFFVYNPKNKIMSSWLSRYQGKAVKFYGSDLKSNLIGDHNKSNVGAAVTVAKILKIPDQTIKRAIKDFRGLPHRLEFIGQFKGVKFYDDAISTTPQSTIEAIKALKKIDTIFLGGEDRGYDFSQLEKTLKKHKIKNIVLFPDSGKKIIKNRKSFNILNTSSMEKAVSFACKHTKKGSICLLSCASPSYSLWKNFEEKGKQFKYFVKKLAPTP